MAGMRMSRRRADARDHQRRWAWGLIGIGVALIVAAVAADGLHWHELTPLLVLGPIVILAGAARLSYPGERAATTEAGPESRESGDHDGTNI